MPMVKAMVGMPMVNGHADASHANYHADGPHADGTLLCTNACMCLYVCFSV